MQTVTVGVDDGTVTVDGVSRLVSLPPQIDPNVRAIRFHPNKGSSLASFEVYAGFRDALTGDAARAFIQPFVDAWEAAAPVPADDPVVPPLAPAAQPEGTDRL